MIMIGWVTMAKLFARLIEPPRDRIPAEKQMFSNADLKALIIPLIIEQVLVMTVGMADTMMVCTPARPPFLACLWST